MIKRFMTLFKMALLGDFPKFTLVFSLGAQKVSVYFQK